MKEFEKLYKNFPELLAIRPEIEQTYHMLIECYKHEGTVYVCGNGGSASDSEHIVGELMKGFKRSRPLSEEKKKRFYEIFGDEGKYISDNLQQSLRAVSLVSQTALTTAFLNDVAGDLLFAQQIHGYAKPNDILLGISTSGNSKNIIYALQAGKALGIKTIGLTGQRDSRISELADVTIKAPSSETYRIQEYHLPIYHALCAAVEEFFFDV